MKPAPGKMVTRHVRLVEPIGEGAMGSVWLADHLTLHTRVAVKFIAAELARDNPDVIVRFRREASSSAQIKSQYVVQVFDHGLSEEGAPYIVMEYLEGESLGERLDRTGVITLRQTAQVVVQVGKALDRAHQLGIIHRDIKPDNIFLSTAEEGMVCKVLDFGIAKHTKLADQKGQTLPGTTVGTPEYMSREQVMTARDVDASADRWALAVVAYQCLTGILPFDGPTLGMVCVAISAGKFEPPTNLCDDLPPQIDRWFARALHKDESQRFQSCKEMALKFMRLIPKIADEDSWVQSGEFSMPPPSSTRAAAIGQVQLLGDGAPGSVPELDPPPSSGAALFRRETPTFSGAAAELAAGPTTRRWRSKAVGVIAAVVLLGAGIVVGVVLATSDGSPAAQPAIPTATADDTTLHGEQTSSSEFTAAGSTGSEQSGADADGPSPDGSASATSSASAAPPPRIWRPRPRPQPKRPHRDLGF